MKEEDVKNSCSKINTKASTEGKSEKNRSENTTTQTDRRTGSQTHTHKQTMQNTFQENPPFPTPAPLYFIPALSLPPSKPPLPVTIPSGTSSLYHLTLVFPYLFHFFPFSIYSFFKTFFSYTTSVPSHSSLYYPFLPYPSLLPTPPHSDTPSPSVNNNKW